MTSYQLLHLMQIHDSAFPIGSYTHTFGMETLIQKGKITNQAELMAYCQAYLQHNLAGGDAIIVREAYRQTQARNWQELRRADQICNGMKIAWESRQASQKMGRQFFKTVYALHTIDVLNQLSDMIEQNQLTGHYAVLYGSYTAVLEFDPELALFAFLYASVAGLVQNAVRAIPLGQSTGVQIIHNLIQLVEQVVKSSQSNTLADLSNRALGIEIASMQHQYLLSRLFIS